MKTQSFLHGGGVWIFVAVGVHGLSLRDHGSRRQALQSLTGTVTSTLLANEWQVPPAHAVPVDAESRTTISSIGNALTAYQIIPDTNPNLDPRIQALDATQLIQDLSASQGGALWLGEHHNSAKDHDIQERILRDVHLQRQSRTTTTAPVAVGLEQVEVQFQPVLDDYMKGRISASEMRKLVEWDTRWAWPFEVYQPVFSRAKAAGMPLIALNVNSEDMAFVEKNGLPGLPVDRMRAYIPDASGFAKFAATPEFSTYVDYVIRPSYEVHQRLGLLKYNRAGQLKDSEMTFRNFFSGRVLWDEQMAGRAAAWTRATGGLMVGLVGADHVKFRNGIPGRFARMVGSDQDCISVMLNPTLIDTRPSGTVGMEGADSSRPDSITLQLRYLKEGIDRDSPERILDSSTGGVLPLADYMLIG